MFKVERSSKLIKTGNLSMQKRLVRAGKFRLGIKVEKDGKTYPKAVDYFVPDISDETMLKEFQSIYGERPRLLHVIFPSNHKDEIFSQYLDRYSMSGLECRGDGEAILFNRKVALPFIRQEFVNKSEVVIKHSIAKRLLEYLGDEDKVQDYLTNQVVAVAYDGEGIPIQPIEAIHSEESSRIILPGNIASGEIIISLRCPGDKCPNYHAKKDTCREHARLQFMLTEFLKTRFELRVFEINTTSKNSIKNINSAFASHREHIGFIKGIPFDLNVGLEELTTPDGKKVNQPVMSLSTDYNEVKQAYLSKGRTLAEAYMIPAEMNEPDKLIYPALLSVPDDVSAADTFLGIPKETPSPIKALESNLRRGKDASGNAVLFKVERDLDTGEEVLTRISNSNDAVSTVGSPSVSANMEMDFENDSVIDEEPIPDPDPSIVELQGLFSALKLTPGEIMALKKKYTDTNKLLEASKKELERRNPKPVPEVQAVVAPVTNTSKSTASQIGKSQNPDSLSTEDFLLF